MAHTMLDPFLEEVIDRRRGTISPARVAAALRVTQSQLARIANVHRNTLARSPNSPAVQERLGAVARIVSEAAELMGGDMPRAIVWFRHQPLAGFDGETAAELVAEGHADAVLAHLDVLREGGYA
jgi:uncharacterized protein (DUF2384 family)